MLLCVSMWAGYAWAQDPAIKALVHIYCTRPFAAPGSEGKGITGLGAGFFVGSEGTLLTAYHVVQGCTGGLEIHASSGDLCTKPALVGYDEHRDLAELKCTLNAGAVPVLPIREDFEPLPPPPAGGVIYGHPNAKLNQRLGANFPSDRVISSDHYTVGAGESIFSEPGHDLIEVDATIEPGISGGPLVVDGKAIGVISGSQGAGGRQLGWAIPVRDHRILKRPGGARFDSLPPLTLLRDGRSARGYLRVAMPEERLRLFTESADQLRSLRSDLEVWRSQKGSLSSLRGLRERIATKKRLSSSDIDEIGRTLWAVDHAKPYPHKFESVRDFDWALPIAQPLATFGKGAGLFSGLIVPVGEERVQMTKIATVLNRPDSPKGADADVLRSELQDFLDLIDKEKSSATEYGGQLEPFRKSAARDSALLQRVISKRTGTAGAAYIDNVILESQSYASAVGFWLDHVGLYLRMLELSLTLNANPIILELRLEQH
jgi:hypothetical protein